MQKFEALLITWIVVGIVATTAAVMGVYAPPLSPVLLIPIGILFLYAREKIRTFTTFSFLEKWTFFILVGFWLSHLIGVVTPEVGFDAVWYHLPVVNAIASAHRLIYLPDLYQSVNPLFSDLIFGLGYMVFGELGAKAVGYAFGISVSVATYELSVKSMPRMWALIVTLVISSFQVVAWQSSSFYIDVAKAFWELGLLWSLRALHTTARPKYMWLSGLLLGASLATKLFSLVLIPALVLCARICGINTNLIVRIVFISLLVAMPFYSFAYVTTGNSLFSLSHHVATIELIGSGTSLFEHIAIQTKQIFVAPREFLFARDYTTVLFFVFAPLVVLFWKKMSTKNFLIVLTVWTLMQFIVWWYVPPVSTRYALSGFITGVIVLIWAAQQWVSVQKNATVPLLATIFLAVGINAVPRAVVNYRSGRYILGHQTREEYIRQFFDGSIDHHLIRWHGLTN